MCIRDRQSALAAVETMEEFDIPYKIAVLGDMLELGETSDLIHYTLGKNISSFHLAEVLTIGDMACYIAQGVRDNAKSIKIHHFVNQDQLYKYLKPYMHKKCMVLVKGSRGMKLDQLVNALEKE